MVDENKNRQVSEVVGDTVQVRRISFCGYTTDNGSYHIVVGKSDRRLNLAGCRHIALVQYRSADE